jgi:hypothetical protein
VTSIDQIAYATDLPCAVSTSTCRSFATISPAYAASSPSVRPPNGLKTHTSGRTTSEGQARPAGGCGHPQTVDLCRAAPARAALACAKAPPFAPAAERFALTWSASIAAPSKTPLCPLRASNICSHRPCRLKRLKRLLTVVYGPNSGGQRASARRFSACGRSPRSPPDHPCGAHSGARAAAAARYGITPHRQATEPASPSSRSPREPELANDTTRHT